MSDNTFSYIIYSTGYDIQSNIDHTKYKYSMYDKLFYYVHTLYVVGGFTYMYLGITLFYNCNFVINYIYKSINLYFFFELNFITIKIFINYGLLM